MSHILFSHEASRLTIHVTISCMCVCVGRWKIPTL